MTLSDAVAMPCPQFVGWMTHYTEEPWGMADQVLASFGKDKPKVVDFASTKAALLDWAGGTDG